MWLYYLLSAAAFSLIAGIGWWIDRLSAPVLGFLATVFALIPPGFIWTWPAGHPRPSHSRAVASIAVIAVLAFLVSWLIATRAN